MSFADNATCFWVRAVEKLICMVRKTIATSGDLAHFINVKIIHFRDYLNELMVQKVIGFYTWGLGQVYVSKIIFAWKL